MLMAALAGQELTTLLEELLEGSGSEAEVHRLVESRPDPDALARAVASD